MRRIRPKATRLSRLKIHTRSRRNNKLRFNTIPGLSLKLQRGTRARHTKHFTREFLMRRRHFQRRKRQNSRRQATVTIVKKTPSLTTMPAFSHHMLQARTHRRTTVTRRRTTVNIRIYQVLNYRLFGRAVRKYGFKFLSRISRDMAL